ncbi:MAG: type IX secretion system membrane protein PorP/SprF [Brevinema sp.]
MKKYLFMLFFFIANALYATTYEKRIYQDPASMGMGGIGVSSFGHSFSPNYNPAALGLMADYDIAPFVTLGFNFDLNLLNTVTPSIDSLGQKTQLQLQGPLSLGYMGKGFGIWTTSSALASLENPREIGNLKDIQNISAKLLAEITLNLAYGYKIPFKALDDVSGLSLGATVRFSQRIRNDQFDPATSGNGKFYYGGSFSSDFGLALRIQNWILAASVRDALSTGYKWKDVTGSSIQESSKIPYSVDFGTSYQFLFTQGIINHIALYLEIHDAVNDEISWVNKIKVGSEIKLLNFLSLRLGMYHSFLTGGIGMNWKWGRIDFAYFRDSYLYSFQDPQDRFHLSFTIGLENTPQRKQESRAKKQQKDQLLQKRQELIDQSLQLL